MSMNPIIIDANIRKRQNSILCAATNACLPRNFARDLLIDCSLLEMLGEEKTRTFGLLLRESGSHIAYDRLSANSTRYWIDNEDMQAFFIYRAETSDYSTEDGEMVRVTKYGFREFLDELQRGVVAHAEEGAK